MNLEQLVASIQKLKHQISAKQDEAEVASQQGNDENLSIALSSLARLNSALGKKAAYAKYLARNARQVTERLKTQREVKRSELTLEYSATQAVGKSEHQARVKASEMQKQQDEAFDAYSEAQLIADEADDLAYRTDTFLKMGQSRLSLLKSDKHRG